MISFTFLKTTLAATQRMVSFSRETSQEAATMCEDEKMEVAGSVVVGGGGMRMIPWHSTPSPKLFSAPSRITLCCLKTSLGPPYAYLAEDLQDKEENYLMLVLSGTLSLPFFTRGYRPELRWVL